MTNEVDVRESYILKIDCELLSLLLFDHTMRNNIFGATGEYGSLVKPRIKDTKTEQIAHVRDKAEFFTRHGYATVKKNY